MNLNPRVKGIVGGFLRSRMKPAAKGETYNQRSARYGGRREEGAA
jgi:hypothetical protein